VSDSNYTSGDDYVVEFLGYRFHFNAIDFEQRVNAAAVRLRLVEPGELEEAETADLVELTAHGRIDEPQSALGEYLVRQWERVALVNDESLVYWLRKLIFRGAWLDQRVKENRLEVDWDGETAEFGYKEPDGGRALLELAPVPSWHGSNTGLRLWSRRSTRPRHRTLRRQHWLVPLRGRHRPSHQERRLMRDGQLHLDHQPHQRQRLWLLLPSRERVRSGSGAAHDGPRR
jgi:hypothetical protein